MQQQALSLDQLRDNIYGQEFQLYIQKKNLAILERRHERGRLEAERLEAQRMKVSELTDSLTFNKQELEARRDEMRRLLRTQLLLIKDDGSRAA